MTSSIFRCLSCGGVVEVESSAEDATLCCACGKEYPVVRGIPRFVDSEQYAGSFGREWNRFPQTQLDSANGTRISYQRFRQITQMDPADLRGKRVLEIGCGMGRFLEVLARHGADVYGIDLSLSVEAAAKNLRDYDNCHVCQASVFDLPFGPDFDLVYSFGVLHHTPDPKAAFIAASRLLRPGGRIVVWVYGRGRVKTRWIPRPYSIYGPLARAIPIKWQEPVLKAYTRSALVAGGIPGAGRALRCVLPIQDLRAKGPNRDGYEPDGDDDAREKLRFDWALLSAFDMLTPKYKTQHDDEEVLQWARDAGLSHIESGPVYTSVTGVRRVEAEAVVDPTMDKVHGTGLS